MITLQDIASRVGVTRIVVSRVLNDRVGKIGVSEEKRQLILQVAKELGYTPNRNARALTTKRNRAIGLLVHHPRYETTTIENAGGIFHLLSGMHQVCDPLDYRCVYTCADMRSEVTFEMPRFLLERSVDAVIVHGYLHQKVEKQLLATGLPMGHIGFNLDKETQMPCVSSNMIEAACRLLDLAAKKGKRHAHLYMGNGPGSRKIVEEFLNYASQSCPDLLVTAENSSSLKPTFEEARQHGQKLAAMAAPPEVILCPISVYHPVMIGFEASGRTCPEDVELVTFASEGSHEQRYLASALHVSQIVLPFTSISQHLTQNLVDVVEERATSVGSAFLSCHLLEGETAPTLFGKGLVRQI